MIKSLLYREMIGYKITNIFYKNPFKMDMIKTFCKKMKYSIYIILLKKRNYQDLINIMINLD